MLIERDLAKGETAFIIITMIIIIVVVICSWCCGAANITRCHVVQWLFVGVSVCV